MTSLLLDKLEILRSHERKNKENQRVLQEQIEFEIEMQRRLEMDATIVKLQTQLSIFSKNIEGDIMPNNALIAPRMSSYKGSYRDSNSGSHEKKSFITLKEFQNNLKNITAEQKEIISRPRCDGGRGRKDLIEINPSIKIYNDIIPMFTTMIGIMKKQQEQINQF
jgi:hypothetical protein